MPLDEKENSPFSRPSNTSSPSISLVNNGWRINDPAPTTSTVAIPSDRMPSPSQSSSSFPIDDRPEPPCPSNAPPREIKILLWNTWLLPSLLTGTQFPHVQVRLRVKVEFPSTLSKSPNARIPLLSVSLPYSLPLLSASQSIHSHTHRSLTLHPNPDRRSHARALAISPLLNAYDIVVLNEAFAYKSTLLSRTTHPYRYHPPRPVGRLVDSGLLFLSRHAIVASGWERYAHVAGVDRFAAKGIGFIAVQVEGWPAGGGLQVYGTHMQAGASRAVQLARTAQAGQAGAFVQRTKGGKGVLVFGGDFNMGPRGGKDGEGFSVHYVDREDAGARWGAYERLVGAAGVREVECEQGEEYRGDICRFLVGGLEGKGEGVARYEDLKGREGERLSDTKPMCLTIRLDGGGDSVKDAR
ncbi:hypothetical protein MMC34_002584 [Xylographa carneopallida]|nr:hypothetical protein [Xylographa carneopallida]